MTSLNGPKLSVITITYKDPIGLDKTLSSLHKLRESENWESVIIDSSPNENAPVINKYRSSLPIKHIPCQPEGIYKAINSGVQAASGDLVWILNGGDCVFSNDTLIEIIEKFENDGELDLVCGAVRLFRNGEYQYSKVPNEIFINNLIGANGICQQACIYRLKTLLELGPFSTSLKLASDYEHHFMYFLNHKKVICTESVLADYDMGGSSKEYKKVFTEFKMIHEKLKDRLPITLSLLNVAFRRFYFLKVSALKFTAKSAIGQRLRPLWLSWNRRSE